MVNSHALTGDEDVAKEHTEMAPTEEDHSQHHDEETNREPAPEPAPCGADQAPSAPPADSETTEAGKAAGVAGPPSAEQEAPPGIEQHALQVAVAGGKPSLKGIHRYVPAFSGENGRISLYDFKANDANGDPVDLSRYRGKVVVVMNVASRCDFTAPMYSYMRELQRKYGGNEAFKILAFPCNQFLKREPNSAVEVCKFAEEKHGIRVGATVHFYEKVNVKGPEAHPLWKWLKMEVADPACWGNEIKWNFVKFVIDKQGRVARRVMHFNKVPEKQITRLLEQS